MDYQEAKIRSVRHVPLVRNTNSRKIDFYDRLVEGICRQASDDLNDTNINIRMDAIKFFKSKWFEYLTDLNGEEILRQLLARR